MREEKMTTTNNAVFVRVRKAMLNAGVDADVLGNKAGTDLVNSKKFKDAKARMSFVTSKEFRDASVKPEQRKEELLKLVPFFIGEAQPAITKAELQKYISTPVKEGGLGLTIAVSQINKMLENTKAGVVKKAEGENVFTPATVDAEVKEGDVALQRVMPDEVVIKKSQVSFFEKLWHVATPEQKAEVKRLVAEEAREAVLAAAELAAAEAADELDNMFPSEEA